MAHQADIDRGDIPVQGECRQNGLKPKDVPPGFIEWWEHWTAWEVYTKKHPGQDAMTIAKRGGFGWDELVEFLGAPPTSWRPRDAERYQDYLPPEGKASKL